ncbi:hypothetical protein [Robbsia andropogonis]|nr:hypothetical protein [Robbsia andropogonis]MCP1120697.1 hypothetical protein [Robbsia andropogonis]MCP1130431.1 hypothetical protein [Robbsia andropogonis]
MHHNQRPYSPPQKRDDAIAKFNALFKSADEVERDTHTQRLAEARLRAEEERAVGRIRAIEKVRDAIAEYGFQKADLYG